MLTLLGSASALLRRSFAAVVPSGRSLAVGGLTLPQTACAPRPQAGKKRHKSVIMVYLTGGMAHQDTFDLKPNAPAEIRGEFKPIAPTSPGMQFGEHVPKLAKCMDKLVVMRSLVGQRTSTVAGRA